MTARPRLLLVEDDPRLGPIVRDVLADAWDVELVTTRVTALEAALHRLFDVLVVDRRLPDGDGLDVVRELRRFRVATPVLVLTALGEVHDRVSGLDAGANDYLVKPFDFDELQARLRALTRDYDAPGPSIEIGGWSFRPDDHTVHSPYSGRVALTDRESELLAVLAAAPDRVFSREQLLSAVFERGEQLGTVDTYVHYIRKKTERDLIATVRGRGYRLGTPA
ncbi:two-component system response regulator QseB [Curtobacterium luteum]|uniref:Transcriptional regulator n=1 Tax=Curtobacterium luteum TaxID=33881 RepID=A0A8H9G7F2_9MICO|nr:MULTISPECIES: response regulator transcription factor [Curtobacterium]MBM7801557.1 two-component system response regulator QseB [Curtobacterium luteum]NUU52117.1 response regulator transcription factor [Curtobacterium luteum]GGK89551.1 transcriptional regulator [Curtobacterium luteum]